MTLLTSPLKQATPPRYQSPWWLPGAHLQTVYPVLVLKRHKMAYTRERWETTPHGKTDGDFIDIDRLRGSNDKPMLVVFHGLEGSSESIYAVNLMREAERRGWRGMVPHFRGCSGEVNRLPRAYHSGDAAEIDWILRRAKAEAPQQPLYVAAISLGGNATLKWLGEQGTAAAGVVTAAAGISAPLDLMASGRALEMGFSKLYAQSFLKTMKKTAFAKLERHPGMFDAEAMRAARTLHDFDDLLTAPVHGFKDADDYWTRASAKPGLINVAVPTLVLNAANDPFLPASALPRPDEVSKLVTLDFPAHGGHVGFLSSPFPGAASWMPQRVFHFFEQGN